MIPRALLLLVLAGTLVPHLVLGGATYIRIFDHLDGSAARAVVLAEGGYLFAHPDTIVDPYMGGQPRWLFSKPTDLYYLLFALFSPLTALVVNELVQRVVAFVGMYLLVRRHLLPASPYAALIAAFAAAAFSLLAFWPPANIAVAGTPLVIAAYLDARAGVRVAPALLVAAAYGILTSPIFVGAFLLAVLGAGWLRDLVRAPERATGAALGFLLLLALCHLASDYQLVYGALSATGEPAHRSDMARDGGTLLAALLDAFRNFRAGHSHAATGQMPFILPLSVLALLLACGPMRHAVPELRRGLLFWIGAALATALIYGLWRYDPVREAWRATGLPHANLSRFHWLQPAIWGAIFALSLAVLARAAAPWRRAPALLVVVLGALQIGWNFARTDFADEWRKRRPMRFAEFVSAPLFHDIRASIGLDPATYRVASVGLHPSIAVFNGFRTIDGYHGLYPLRYKRAFRTVIADELARDARLARYFDDWGNRVYVFSSELAFCNYLCTARRAPAAIELGFNTAAFKALGGRFVLSAARIANAPDVGLVERGVFTRTGAPWRIHLYEAPP
jgi:hypothetical protein